MAVAVFVLMVNVYIVLFDVSEEVIISVSWEE